MRKTGLFLVILALSAGRVFARQELAPSLDDGPLTIKPHSETTPAQTHEPQPFAYGFYLVGDGVVAPRIVHAVPAGYPINLLVDSIKGASILAMVIDVSGIPTGVHVVRSHGEQFDAAAIKAVMQSKFEPGTVHDKPVPVRIDVRVPFFDDYSPAIPMILPGKRTVSQQISPAAPFSPSFAQPDRVNVNSVGKDVTLPVPPQTKTFGLEVSSAAPSSQSDNQIYKIGGDVKAPVILRMVNAEFSTEARRAKYQGICILSLVVDKQGMPQDIHVIRQLGMGLDQNAVKSVKKYRFKPATKEGEPVAVRVNVEVNFRLY
ncbi:MAG: energy transducer TonB [Terracidiphilus sp.]|jgi:TonB family protein